MVVTLYVGSRSKSRDGAFTLIELLAVIAAIAILAALLIPALSSGKTYAHSTSCKNHLRQMGLGLQMYVHDNQNKYPFYLTVEPQGERSYWSGKLLPYYPVNWTNTEYHCPGYKGAVSDEVPVKHGPLGSYAYNQFGVASFIAAYTGSNGITVNFPHEFLGLDQPKRLLPALSEFRILVPSEMCAIGESRFLNANVNWSPGGADFMQSGMLIMDWNKNVKSLHQGWAFDPSRHGKNYNQLFCDGHVAGMSPWLWFDPTNSASMWNNDHQPHPEVWLPESY